MLTCATSLCWGFGPFNARGLAEFHWRSNGYKGLFSFRPSLSLSSPLPVSPRPLPLLFLSPRRKKKKRGVGSGKEEPARTREIQGRKARRKKHGPGGRAVENKTGETAPDTLLSQGGLCVAPVCVNLACVGCVCPWGDPEQTRVNSTVHTPIHSLFLARSHANPPESG